MGESASVAARRRLTEEIRRLGARLGSGEETALSMLMDQCVPGRAPPLRQLEDQRMLANLRDRDRDRLRELIEALRRVEAGTWGTCQACGGAISPERLDLIPETPVCGVCVEDGGRG